MAQTYRPQPLRAIFEQIIDPVVAEYAGVRMRSRLETSFARYLDAQGVPWRYEPALYGDYLPDFELVGAEIVTFVEVKPRLADVDEAKRRMRAIWAFQPEALLIVACAEECRWFAATGGREWTSWVDRWAH